MEKQGFVLTLSCPDRIGIVASITTTLADMGLFILDLAQYSDRSTGKFFLRIHFETTDPILEGTIATAFSPIAAQFNMQWQLHNTQYRPKVLLMVSKHSHCLNDLLHRWSSGTLHIDIRAIVSNHKTLEKMASWYHVPFHHMPITATNKSEQEATLLDVINSHTIDLVILARYMQILSDTTCHMLHGKTINIHHSFLPSFKGAKPYHQAFDRGVKIIGATAHYVTADLDEGPIIEQETIHVRHDHTPQDLIQLGKDVECRVLARAVKLHVQQRVLLNDHKTVVFN